MSTNETPLEEQFSSGDRMLDPIEADTERHLRGQFKIDRHTGQVYSPTLRGEEAGR